LENELTHFPRCFKLPPGVCTASSLLPPPPSHTPSLSYLPHCTRQPIRRPYERADVVSPPPSTNPQIVYDQSSQTFLLFHITGGSSFGLCVVAVCAKCLLRVAKSERVLSSEAGLARGTSMMEERAYCYRSTLSTCQLVDSG
jgi:hypothetical protein